MLFCADICSCASIISGIIPHLQALSCQQYVKDSAKNRRFYTCGFYISKLLLNLDSFAAVLFPHLRGNMVIHQQQIHLLGQENHALGALSQLAGVHDRNHPAGVPGKGLDHPNLIQTKICIAVLIVDGVDGEKGQIRAVRGKLPFAHVSISGAFQWIHGPAYSDKADGGILHQDAEGSIVIGDHSKLQIESGHLLGQHRVCSPRVEGHHVALLDVVQRLAGSLSLQLAVDDLPAGEVGKQILIFRQTGSTPDIFDPSSDSESWQESSTSFQELSIHTFFVEFSCFALVA